jgi:hypothetical protein
MVSESAMLIQNGDPDLIPDDIRRLGRSLMQVVIAGAEVWGDFPRDSGAGPLRP